MFTWMLKISTPKFVFDIHTFEITTTSPEHDDVIKWKHFPHYWPFVRGIHRSPVNSLHKGRWCRALMFSLICTWINGCSINREASDLRCNCAHYDVTVMSLILGHHCFKWWIGAQTCEAIIGIKVESWSLTRPHWTIFNKNSLNIQMFSFKEKLF